VCEQKSTEKDNVKNFANCSRSRIDVHFCFGSDGLRRHSKTQSAVPAPTADCPRVHAIFSSTPDDLARADFCRTPCALATYIGLEVSPNIVMRRPFRISVAVAGFTEADLSIETKGNSLTIHGEKQANDEEKTGDVL
jgi:hypothetical protein